MNFLQQIKDDMNHERNRHGLRDKCLVDSRALYELVEQFEILDSKARAIHAQGGGANIYQVLSYAIHGAYHHQRKDSEAVMCVIMDTLRPLINERIKTNDIRARFDGRFYD